MRLLSREKYPSGTDSGLLQRFTISLEGEGIMFIDNDSQKVYPGQTIYIPPNAKQRIKNTGKSDLKFLCIVDPAWKKEDEEIV